MMRKTLGILAFLIFIIITIHSNPINSVVLEDELVDNEKILYPLKIDNAFGFINKLGELIIPPQYEEAYQSTCEVAVGVNENGTFYHDVKGIVLFSTESTHAFPRRFSNEVVARCINEDQIDEKWGYVDKNGNWLIEPVYSIADDFSEGYANVSYTTSDESFYIDLNNKPVFNGKKFKGAKFKNGYAQVWERNVEEILIKREYGVERITPSASGFIDIKGELIIPYIFRTYTEYADSLICFNFFNMERIMNDESSYFGYMNIKQEIIIEPQFLLAYDFHEGFAVVSIDGKNYGMINKEGEYIFSPEYKYLSEISENLICFSKNGINYGYMNINGEIIIPAIFSFGYAFNGSLAYINKDGIPGYVNRYGDYFLAIDY